MRTFALNFQPPKISERFLSTIILKKITKFKKFVYEVNSSKNSKYFKNLFWKIPL